QDRQGARRFSAGRAGNVRNAARLHWQRCAHAGHRRMSNANGSDAGRIDLDLIARMIAPESRVLDVGCGDGDLLALLRAQKDIDGRGVELSQEGVNASVARGLAVVQGDADTDLVDYPDDAFDYVILSQTIQ